MINRVRSAVLADAAAIARIDVECWRATYAGLLPDKLLIGLSESERRRVWTSYIARHPGDIMVGTDPDGRVQGFGNCGRARDAFARFAARGGDDLAVSTERSATRRQPDQASPRRNDPSPDTGEVFTLYVATDHQGRGLGRDLLLALFGRLLRRKLQSAVIWVLRDNPSRFFYERLGGRLVGHRPLQIAGTTIAASAYGWADLASAIMTQARSDSPGSDEPG
jgi:ribosomal protein S18 acetylase RimI-like enzyme